MLVALSICDFVIIDRLDLSFASGLTALTGETGAGKSILLDALGIAIGMRSEASLIRKGADQAIISAEFMVPLDHPATKLLQEQAIPVDNGPILIRRVIQGQGRSKAFVNDQAVSVGLLRQLGDLLLEIHGQFDRLLDAASHRRFLDAYLAKPPLIQTVQQHYHLWQQAENEAKLAAERLDHLRRHEDFLRYQLKELQSLRLQEGEEETLLAKRAGLADFAKLFDVMRQAGQAMGGGEVLNQLQMAFKALQKFPAQQNPCVDAAVSSLTRAISEVTEAMAQLEELQGQIEDQPQQLQTIDDRLHALRTVARKHNKLVGDLPNFYESLLQDINSLDKAEDHLQQLHLQVAKVKQQFYGVAQELMTARRQAAVALDQAIMVELPELKLPQARFVTQITELQESSWHEQGIDRVGFYVAMNKGQDLHPLEKAASGGEVARLMLSLKATLAKASPVATIIFDEIDIGVGGAVAAAIGQRLAKLAQHRQVLAITHSPQVAAAADQHYQVLKQEVSEQVRTKVVPLPLANRYEEIARMLSAEQVTEEARAAAKSLLARYG